jgi:hypothetical protein
LLWRLGNSELDGAPDRGSRARSPASIEAKIGGADLVAVCEQNSALDDVVQLTDLRIDIEQYNLRENGRYSVLHNGQERERSRSLCLWTVPWPDNFIHIHGG